MNHYFYSLKLTLKYINKYPIYWFWFFVHFIVVSLTLLIPVLLGFLIDLLSSSSYDLPKIYLFGGLWALIVLIHPALHILAVSKGLYISNKVARDFRNDAIRSLENAKPDFFKKRDKGLVLKVIDSAYWSIYKMSDNILHRYMPAFALIFGIFLSSVFFNKFVVIAFITATTIFVFNLSIFGKREKVAVLESYKKEENVLGGLTEFLNNFKTVLYLNLFEKQQKDLFKRTKSSYHKFNSQIKTSLTKWYNDGQLHSVFLVIIFIYGLFNVIKGNFTVGILVIVLSFAEKLSAQLDNLLAHSETYMQNTNALQRYHEIFRDLKFHKNKKTGLIGENFKKILFKKVGLKRDGRENLQNVSFKIKRGSKIAIIGETGGGKSTLLDILLKATTNYRGKVILNGIEYRRLNISDIVNFFSIVPQEVQLFKTSIKENILPTSREVSGDELKKVLRVCKLDSFINHLPKKINQPVFEGSQNVSGGERQRIGIARALLQNNQILILDEATASLDPKIEREVVKNILREYSDLTILYITHKYSLLNHFDEILVFSDGQIVEKGSFDELKNKKGMFSELYRASKIK